MVMMYSFHERFPGIIIPRNLCSCTRAIEVLFMKVFNSEELICLRRGWNMMNLNLSGWTITLFALMVLHADLPVTVPMGKTGTRARWRLYTWLFVILVTKSFLKRQTNMQKKTKQLSTFLTRKPFKRKSFFKNSFLSDKKVKKQNLSFQNRVLLQYWNEEILPQRRLNYCICKVRRVCAGGSERN